MKYLIPSVLALSLLFACGGDENPVDPDAGVDALPPPPPPPPPPQTVDISGRVTSLGAYLAGDNQYVGSANVLPLGVVGVQGVLSAEGGALGTYSVTVPANGQLVFFVNKAGYYPTYTPVTVQQYDIADQRLYLTAVDWLNAIATAHNVDLANAFDCHEPALNPAYQCRYAAVVGRILDDGSAGNGTVRPVANITKDHFTITGGPDNANWYVKGPYFLEPNGTPNANNAASVVNNEYQGGLYVAFVEIPVANGPEVTNLKFSITYNDRQFGPQYLQAHRNYGVTWASIYETGNVPPPVLENVDFDTQVYPLFLPVNQGGYGCQGCHTNQGGAVPAGGMNLYGGPEAAYASLNPDNYPQRVNVANAAYSYLLTKPLYETTGVQDHPIYAFASPQDPGYQIIYKWIQEGGKREVDAPLVSFANQVRPILYNPTATGGAGCIACHGDQNNQPGGLYMGGDAAALYAELTAEAAVDNGATGEAYRVNKQGYPERSLLLINPLYEHPEPHPVKLFSSNADPRYQIIYKWIAEGYQNN